MNRFIRVKDHDIQKHIGEKDEQKVEKNNKERYNP